MRQVEPRWIPSPQDLLQDFWMYCGEWSVAFKRERWAFVAQREVIKRCSAKRNRFIPIAKISN